MITIGTHNNNNMISRRVMGLYTCHRRKTGLASVFLAFRCLSREAAVHQRQYLLLTKQCIN